MKHTGFALAGLLAAALAMAGCDNPQDVPLNAQGKAPGLLTCVSPAETQEAQQLMNDHEAYRYDLMVIRAYYDRLGLFYKREWADRELKNFRGRRPGPTRASSRPPWPKPRP